MPVKIMEKPKEKKASNVNKVSTKLRPNASTEIRRPPRGRTHSDEREAHTRLIEEVRPFEEKPKLKANPRKFPVLPPEEDD